MIALSRRRLLGIGLAGIVATPAIVRAASIMKVRPQRWASGGIISDLGLPFPGEIPTEMLIPARFIVVQGLPFEKLENLLGVSPRRIYIDNVPIQAADGAWNFRGAILDPVTGRWTGERVKV